MSDGAWVLVACDESTPGEVHVRVALRRGTPLACPVCHGPARVYDRRPRSYPWRDIDDGGDLVFVHALLTRVKCEQHRVREVPVPWARPRSHFTRNFESWAIASAKSGSTLARNLRITRNEAAGIRAATPPPPARPRFPVGVPPDEAARVLGIGEDGVYGLVLTGELRAVRWPQRPGEVAILEDGIERMLAARVHERERLWAKAVAIADLRAQGRMCARCDFSFDPPRRSTKGRKLAWCSNCRSYGHACSQATHRVRAQVRARLKPMVRPTKVR